MERMKKEYERPELCIEQFSAEQGFAGSDTPTDPSQPGGPKSKGFYDDYDYELTDY